MCGIVALVHLDNSPVDPDLLARMTATLSHRGPDGQDQWVEGPVGLGHRRLAIFDTTDTGRQPMAGMDDRMVVSFNGAIYDYRERMTALKTEGVQFRGTSDTEVLVNSLERHGPRSFETFNGMFAFAAADRREGTVHLVRDRFGVKPLYIWTNGRIFIAASEIRAILAHPAVPRRPNMAAIREYLTFQNVFRSHTFFEEIEMLPAGHHLVIRLSDRTIERRRWWDYDFSQPQESLSFDEACEETRHLLIQSVRRQIVADVPVGSYLSGGIDSGAITALASQGLPRISTFTCGFDVSRVTGLEANFDERRQAEQLAALLQTRHFECVIAAKDIEAGIPLLTNHLEDLRLGMAYPNFYTAELASKFVKVALSGTGGDELFGGYPWRYYRVFRSVDREDYLNAYFDYWQRLIPLEEQEQSFSGDFLHDTRNDATAYDIFHSVFEQSDDLRFNSPEDQIASSLYFEAKTFLSGLLVLQDKISMAHGLEERVPFLDNDLADFAMKIPVRHKLANLSEMKKLDENEYAKIKTRHSQFDDGKSVLRKAIKDLIPPEITHRPKQGFSSPEASWYRGDAMQFVQARLGPGSRTALPTLISSDYIHDVLTTHMSGRRNHRLLIWSFLCLDAWLSSNFPEMAQAA